MPEEPDWKARALAAEAALARVRALRCCVGHAELCCECHDRIRTALDG